VAADRGSLTSHPDILVVGAGPTGLTAALQAHDHGATVRVVERRPQAFRPSRAMIVHARTLESLRPLGATDVLLDRADTSPGAELHLGDRRIRLNLADLDLPDTAFPHLTLVRQADVESVLVRCLTRRGIVVERETELVDLKMIPDHGGVVHAVVRSTSGVTEIRPRFVIGSDGSESTVRKLAGIGWPGGRYREEAILADVELEGLAPSDTLHVAAGRGGLCFLFALGEGSTWRMLATRRSGDPPFLGPGSRVRAPDVQRLLDAAGLQVAVINLGWSERVSLQYRLAAAFRDGPVFLVGDAAHTQSPAGALGMNSGILDAANVGWKLAYAARGAKQDELLMSYEQERRPVARRLLVLTHLLFFAEASRHPLSSFLRGTAAPLTAPVVARLTNQRWLMAQAVRTVAQLRVDYRHSAISVNGAPSAGGPRPGDRLPDETVICDGQTVRLHEITARSGIKVFIFGDAEKPDVRTLGSRVTVHRLDSKPGGDIMAVRPDGHVGFRSGIAEPARLVAWLDLVGARA